VKYRRAGEPAAPTPLRARRAIEVTPRSILPPGWMGCIRGIAALAEARRQTPAAWNEVWADHVATKSASS
jgi:hypothetical protein